MRSLVESLPVVVYVDAPDDELASLWISPNVERMLGYSADEWRRDRSLMARILHHDDVERLRHESRQTEIGREHTTKVDRSFVRDVPHDPESAAVVTTIARLAENLGVTALLLGLPCADGQGFLFARPMAPAEIEELWAADQQRAA
jgi:PAS domain-containing protein